MAVLAKRQERMRINGVEIWQPDEGLKFRTETTFSSDSVRAMNGIGYFTPLFTVEQLGYSASNVPQQEVTKILQMIDQAQYFTLHYFSMHYGGWRDGTFFVGQGEYDVSSWKVGEERVKLLSFNMTGVNPL